MGLERGRARGSARAGAVLARLRRHAPVHAVLAAAGVARARGAGTGLAIAFAGPGDYGRHDDGASRWCAWRVYLAAAAVRCRLAVDVRSDRLAVVSNAATVPPARTRRVDSRA